MRSNLKLALSARRMRQAELAHAIGISPSTLSEFISGRTDLAPHFRSRIAEELQADPTWLFARGAYIPALRERSGDVAAVGPEGLTQGDA